MMDKAQWEQHGGAAFPSGDSSRFYPELGMSACETISQRK